MPIRRASDGLTRECVVYLFVRKCIPALFTAVVLGTPGNALAVETVRFDGYPAGTVVVKTGERRLYYTLGDGTALRYTVGVGRAGRTWTGTSYISGKHLKPAWAPPDEIRRDKPNLPKVIPGGAASNPMGAAALTLGSGEYAIHGTNRPESIGGFVSYGCIRMHNEDVLDLFGRVRWGTQVIVVQ